jgi:hypothetical protein
MFGEAAGFIWLPRHFRTEKKMRLIHCLMKYLFLMAAPLIANAQIAPGEDPVQLTEKVVHNMLPFNNPMRSTPFQNVQFAPAWIDAKLARIQAKAFSADTAGILTEKDVSNTTITDGINKTCIQDVGAAASAAASSINKYGNTTKDQIVVLRGDLINFCR